MFIKRIYLQNIRSYTDQEINFNTGITLLSGDIGSGKSTILLAIEFALFGIRRGAMSGTSLLRKGEKEGEVALNFQVDGKDIEIKRVLKKTSTSVNQGAGFIRVGNDRYDGTAVELKQRALDILHYPSDLLTRSKEDIFEYTVYTPQEQMKQILFSKKEERLNTLRRLFDIEKYKTISNNCQLFLTRLRYKIRELSERIKPLEARKEEKIEIEKNKKDVESKKEKLMPLLLKAEKDVLEKKDELLSLEEKRLLLHELEKQKEIREANMRHLLQRVKELEKKQSHVHTIINQFEQELTHQEMRDHQQEINTGTEKAVKLEKELRSVRDALQDCRSKISGSREMINNITKLDVCPTCKQEVTHTHKHAMGQKESLTIKEFEKKLELLAQEEKSKEELLKEMRMAIEKLMESQRKNDLLALKREQVKQRKAELNEITSDIQSSKKMAEKLDTDNKEGGKKIEAMADVEKRVHAIKKDEEKLQKEFRALEIHHTELIKDLEKYTDLLAVISRLILEMDQQNEQLKRMKEISNWLEQYFLPLMSQIEKNVMVKIYTEFTFLFQKWAGMLIDGELMSARLDYDFSPLIEQNGYDIGYEDLSGGEKTALALAYRLALNQLVTEIHGKIKSKDLLILDEPTDGFSTEQLDRLKDVVSEIKANQIIIVSHESKIESFADHLLRISKEGHVSSITQ